MSRRLGGAWNFLFAGIKCSSRILPLQALEALIKQQLRKLEMNDERGARRVAGREAGRSFACFTSPDPDQHTCIEGGSGVLAIFACRDK